MRILIVEDEEVVRRRLERLTREILGRQAQRVDQAEDLHDAVDALASVPYDLVLLDLNLYGHDGFALLRHAAAGAFVTIVISAHEERALEGFDHGILDFVPKPFDRRRLERALRRAVDRRGSRSRLAIRSRGEVSYLELDEVVFLRAAGDYSTIHLEDGESRLHENRLSELEKVLPRPFLRIHRSYLVDLRRVEKLRSEPGSRYFALLDDGRVLPVGRTRIEGLRQALLEL